MIFTETRDGRRFVGEVPPGQPLVATLRQLADSYRIDSGWMEGTGVIRDAVLIGLDAEGMPGQPRVVAGFSQLVSCKVSISMRGTDRDISARVLLVTAAGETAAGLLQEAVSASVELMAWTFDDITLRRHEDYSSGLWRWMDVGINVVSASASAGPSRSGRVAMEAMPSRLLEPEEMPNLKVGDALEHPALGFCIVTQVFDQDRVSIQMETGKVAQLHLGVLTLHRAPSKQGRSVYAVQVRRRNV
jgi:predicted DNA-binding protein with PD1-like motif